jgi:hypothetical protein
MQLYRQPCDGEKAEVEQAQAAADGYGQGRENQPNVQKGQPTRASAAFLSLQPRCAEPNGDAYFKASTVADWLSASRKIQEPRRARVQIAFPI